MGKKKIKGYKDQMLASTSIVLYIETDQRRKESKFWVKKIKSES